MNTKTIFRSVAVLLTLGMTFTACNNDENPTTTTVPTTTTTRLTAALNGASEKPTSTTSTATGNFVGDLNESTRVLSYTVTYTGPFSSSLTGGHIHRITSTTGATAMTGGIEIPFASLTSPITGTATLANQSRVDSMKNGFYYTNLHTTLYPNGEIRGDIKKQ